MPKGSKAKLVFTAACLLGYTLNGQAARTDVYSDVKRMRISNAPEASKLLGKTIQRKGKLYYIVDLDENLGFIASKLYGTIRYVPKIRNWNNNIDPNNIQAGQLLLLQEEPRYKTPEAQSEQLLRQIARKFKLEPNWHKKTNAEGIEIGKMVTQTKELKAKETRAPQSDSKKNPLTREHQLKRQQGGHAAVPRVKDTAQGIKLQHDDQAVQPELLALIAAANLLNSDTLGQVGAKLYEEKHYHTAQLFLQAARKKNDKHFQSWLQELFVQRRCGSEAGLLALKNDLTESSIEAPVREQILSIVASQKEAPCDARDTKPDLHLLPLAVMIESANNLQKQGDCSNSLLFAKAAREKQPSEVKPWILEITCLKTMGQAGAAKLSVSQFVEEHPEMSQLPFLKIE